MKNPARISLVLSALLAFASAALAGQKDRTLDVYWIDSEGGGSTLIVTPNDESVLIDTGNPGARDPARIVAAVKAAGLTKLDYVAITHWHGDHYGGAAEVAKEIPFGVLYQREIPAGDPDGRAQSAFQTQIKPFRDIATKRESLAPGVVIPLKTVGKTGFLARLTGSVGPKLELRVLAADKKFVEPTAEQMKTKNPLTSQPPPSPIAPTDNDNSAVFLLSFGDFKFFDGGDLTWHYEEKLVTPYNLPGVVDVYQTNHHGLQVSNNPVLLQSLAPTVVLMNNGPRKGGQPGSFAAIKSASSVQALYQIHQSYNIPAEQNAPKEFIANHDNLTGADAAKCPANIIKMSVAPDGKSYTISIPATGHSRTYQTKGM